MLVPRDLHLGAGGQVVGAVASQICAAPRAPVGPGRPPSAPSAPSMPPRPSANLPREFYGERITVNFNAREACS